MRNEKELNTDIETIDTKIKAIDNAMTELNKSYGNWEVIRGKYCIIRAGAREELNLLKNAEKAAVHTKPGVWKN